MFNKWIGILLVLAGCGVALAATAVSSMAGAGVLAGYGLAAAILTLGIALIQRSRTK